MKQANLFCLVSQVDIPQTTMFHGTLLLSLESFQWVGVHQTWFETIWSASVEAIDYWTNFSMKVKLKKLYWNLGTFFAFWESSWWARYNRIYFTIFKDMVWKLLIIEPFFQWKLNKIETENYIKVWGHSRWCWKAFGESDLIEFIAQFSELRCRGYWFLGEFCCWKFKQIAKIGFGRKNQLSPQCVHTWTDGIGYTSEDEA